MRKNVWKGLKKPFWALAPMDDVTNTYFRQSVACLGKPDLFFTEFTNVAGLCSAGSAAVEARLKYCEIERPIVAQLWGLSPEQFFMAAKRVADLGFDGIDINLGCPVRDVTREGACSAMIGKTDIVSEIIEATRKGGGLPVSVKTRLGIKEIMTEEWIGFLLKQKLAAVIVHGRTVSEMSAVPAHWGEIGKVVCLRNQMGVETLIVGNGDVKSLSEGREKAKAWEVDGVMIGRGVLENPWVFAERDEIDIETRVEAFRFHASLWKEDGGNLRNFAVLKKFAKAYIRNFDGAAEVRGELLETKTWEEMEQILDRVA